MDPVLLAQALGFLVGVPVTLWISHRQIRQFRQRSRLRAWQSAAKSCGLHIVEMGPPLRARRGPVEVRIDSVQGRYEETQITIAVSGPPDFDKVRLHPAATKPLHPHHRVLEIETGDARFDRAFSLEGPAGLVLALLDEPMRQLLLSLNARGRLEIADGEIRTEVFYRMLSHVLPSLVEVGRRLDHPRDVLWRLTENTRSDPEPGVRLQNLLLLIHEHSGNPVTVKALHAACLDPNDAPRAEAVSALGRELSIERTRAILDHALDGSHPKTARACLEMLGRSGDAAAAEPPLILALQQEHADLRVAAADALGHVGSAAAVLPLEEAAERFWLDLELRRAVHQAIAEIQSRLQGASPGQLSLASSEAGQLSLAQAEAGQLSLATDQTGQLSLPPKS